MTVQGFIESIQVGLPAEVTATTAESSADTTWTTGFLKQPVAGPVRLRRHNLDGDGQADRQHHGGPDKAVCVYCRDHYPDWEAELQQTLPAAAFGENLSISGLTEAEVCIGDIWIIGDAEVQISQPRQPCWKLSRWRQIPDLAARVQQSGRTGWYLRVLKTGDIVSGAPIQRIRRFHPEWSVAAANRIMHHAKSDLDGARQLAALAELSASWRETLTRRVQRRTQVSPELRLSGREADS